MAPRQRRPLIELGHLRCQVMQMWHTYLTSLDKRGYWRGAVEALRTTARILEKSCRGAKDNRAESHSGPRFRRDPTEPKCDTMFCGRG